MSRIGPPGFTLIELLMLIVVFFGSLVALLSVGLEASRRGADTDAASRAMQFAQEGAEMVLADRRNPQRNYAFVPLQSASCTTRSTTCAYPFESSLSGSSLDRGVQISDASTSALCPNPAAGCKRVHVVVSDHGRSVALVSLMLANS